MDAVIVMVGVPVMLRMVVRGEAGSLDKGITGIGGISYVTVGGSDIMSPLAALVVLEFPKGRVTFGGSGFPLFGVPNGCGSGSA
jgi:hypothetical protein